MIGCAVTTGGVVNFGVCCCGVGGAEEKGVPGVAVLPGVANAE